MSRPTPAPRRLGALALALVLALAVTSAAGAADSTPTPEPIPATEPTPTPEPIPATDPVPAADATPTPDPTPSPDPTPTPAPDPTPTPDPTPSPPPPALAVAIRQAAVSYDATTNQARVRITVTPSGAVVPWAYAVAVRGTTVTSGTTEAVSVAVTVTNACSITTQSVTATVTDAAGRTAGVAATLDRSLCPPPPDVPHAGDRILAGPTLTEDSFVDRLRAAGSPALPEGRAIYRALVAARVNPAFALGTFHAESHSGTRGYAVTTRNWGNILYYSWQAEYGAVPYAPGNGYTYAMYPSWLASVRAYAALLVRYDAGGYTTVSSASARWLGTTEGSSRHLTYLRNITYVMALLPDDAVPVMTGLVVPATSRAAVAVTWSARDNLGVTGYQVRWRPAGGAWSTPEAWAETRRTLTLATGTWQIGVRAADAAGNWSSWRYGTVAVDAGLPEMTGLTTPTIVPRAANGRFTVRWTARDDVGVVRYQLRTRRSTSSAWSTPVTTTARSRELALGGATWVVAVRARDAVGNWSAWRELVVVVPRDDRGWSFSTGTARPTGSGYFRGTLTTTRRAAAKMTVTFTGTALYLVGPSGPSYGRMRVTVDGVSTIVDAGTYAGARATRTRQRTILFSTTVPAGSHTVVITNLATPGRPTIGIDGIATRS
jgi:hypothetical protein